MLRGRMPGCTGAEIALEGSCGGTAFGSVWLADAARWAWMLACCGRAAEAPWMYRGTFCQAGRGGGAMGTPPEEGTTFRTPAK